MRFRSISRFVWSTNWNCLLFRHSGRFTMIRFNQTYSAPVFVCVAGLTFFALRASAQNGGTTFRNNYHVSFDRAGAGGLKDFAGATLLSGVQPPEPGEGRRVGAVS